MLVEDIRDDGRVVKVAVQQLVMNEIRVLTPFSKRGKVAG